MYKNFLYNTKSWLHTVLHPKEDFSNHLGGGIQLDCHLLASLAAQKREIQQDFDCC